MIAMSKSTYNIPSPCRTIKNDELPIQKKKPQTLLSVALSLLLERRGESDARPDLASDRRKGLFERRDDGDPVVA